MTSVLSRLSEASTTSLMWAGRLSRPSSARRSGRSEAELRGDLHLAAEGREGLAHELLVRERAVDFRGVEERDAVLDGGADHGDHRLPFRGRAVAGAHAHAAEPRAETSRLLLPSFRAERSRPTSLTSGRTRPIELRAGWTWRAPIGVRRIIGFGISIRMRDPAVSDLQRPAVWQRPGANKILRGFLDAGYYG
jgi:hypothetical protein